MNKVPPSDDENVHSIHNERTLAEGFLYYVSVLKNYRLMIVLVTVVAAALAVGFSLLTRLLPPEKSPMPNTYRANATLVVQNSGDDSMASLLASLGLQTDTRGGLDYAQMAIKVIESRQFLDALVDHFKIIEKYGISTNVKSSSRNVIRSNLELIYDRTSGTLTIAYTHIDPEFARDMVNKTVDLLMDWFLQSGSSTQDRQTQLVAAKLQEVSTEIERMETQIKDFQQKYGVLRVEELATRQMDILSSLQSQLVAKEMEINTYRQFSTIDDPNLVKLRSERSNLMTQIREMEEGSTQKGGTLPGSRDLPELAQQFNKLTMDIEIQRRIYQSLSQQLEILKLNIGRQTVFQVLESAEAPDEKAGPERSQMVIMLTVGAFVSSIMLAFALNALTKVKTEHDRKRQ